METEDECGTEYDVTTEEKVENAVEWIEALCSNDYEQMAQRMGDDCEEGFCCLGVARHELSLDDSDYNKHYLTQQEKTEMGLLNCDGSTDTANTHALSYLNDHGSSHLSIVRVMLRDLDEYFETEVAEGIAEHFWGDQ